MALLNTGRRDGIRDIGQLDRKITLETNTLGKSDLGSVTESWSTLAEVWAMLEPKFRKMSEGLAAGKETSFQEYHFVIRFRDDLTKIHRVVWRSKNYDIVSIQEMGRDQYLRLVTELRE